MIEPRVPRTFSAYEHDRHINYLLESARYNHKLFIELAYGPNDPSEFNHSLFGAFNTTMLLLALAIENTIKSRIYYKERNSIIDNQLVSIADFMKEFEWHGISHSFLKLLRKHSIAIDEAEVELLEIIQPYALWAGRFPFPLKDESDADIEIMKGSLGPQTIDRVTDFINRLRNEVDSKR